MKLTLGDVLAQRDLGLEPLSGDAEAMERPVAGAHSIEVAFPSRWLPRDWIMLTNGLRLRGRADEQRRLVAELHEGGQAALGWAVGLVLQRVPRAVIDEARRRNFPVFLVPIETPFREIISYVNGALLSDDLFAMRRAMSMQDFLMDALRLDDPEPVILERLATLLEADVVRVGANGDLLHRTGRTAPEDVGWLQNGNGGDGFREADLGGRRGIGAPVATEHRAAGYVGVVLSGGRAPDRLVKPVVRSAAHLLALVAHARRLETSEERAHRAELLATMLDADGGDDRALEQHARELGVTFEQPVHVVAWGCDGGRQTVPADLVEPLTAGVEAALTDAGLPYLVAPRDGWVAGLVEGPLDAVTAHLIPPPAQAAGVCAGIGRAAGSVADVGQSATDARVALEHAGRGDRPQVVAFDDLDPASWLLATSDHAVVAERIAGLLDPLRDQPALLETLRCYFDCDMNVAQAAQRLTLHRNTLRYRLARIEDLLGMPLDAPRTIANIHMALLSDTLR